MSRKNTRHLFSLNLLIDKEHPRATTTTTTRNDISKEQKPGVITRLHIQEHAQRKSFPSSFRVRQDGVPVLARNAK